MFVVIEGGLDDDGSSYILNTYVFTSAEEAYAYRPAINSHWANVYEATNGDEAWEQIYDKGRDSVYCDDYYRDCICE